MSVTLLDYDVFDALKSQIQTLDPNLLPEWSASVLGYGFRAPSAAQMPAFVLLCRPQALKLQESALSQLAPSGAVVCGDCVLPISVSQDVTEPLLHQLDLDPPKRTPPRLSDLSDELRVALGQTLREVLLQDHRKLILPAYLLRYTPYTSPNLIVLRAALNQIHYLHQAGGERAGEFVQRTVTARMSEISRWSNLSRTTIYRLLHGDERSQWLIDVENRGAYQNEQGQHIALSNQYLLQPLRLTPGDATDFAHYLKVNRGSWEDVDVCLEALAQINPRQILAYPYRTPESSDRAQPASILTLLKEEWGAFELTAERLAWIDRVRDHFIGDDFVAVPWYVMRNLLPVYGSSIITLYWMCQPLLFQNGRVKRDTFWLPGGEKTLTAWTGDRSIAKYFPKNAKGRGRPASGGDSTDEAWRRSKRNLLADFFFRTDTRKDSQGSVSWQITVNAHPVLPQDQRRLALTYELIADLIQQGQLASLLSLFTIESISNWSPGSTSLLDLIYRCPAGSDAQQALSLIANHIISENETPVQFSLSQFETPVDRLLSLLETSAGLLIADNATPVARFFSEFETYLKILFSIKDSLKHLTDSNHPQDSTDSERLAGQAESRFLPDIAEKYQQILRAKPTVYRHFYAWFVQSSLDPKIQQPVSFAVTMAIRKKSPPGSVALRLADVPPDQLAALLDQLIHQPESVQYHADADIRQTVHALDQLLIGQEQQDRNRLLRRLLSLLQGSA